MWGEEVNNVPPGKNRWAYFLFDVTESYKIDESGFGYEIYKLWEDIYYKYDQKEANQVIPPKVTRNISYKGEYVELSPELYESLQKMIGKARKVYAEDYVMFGDYSTDDIPTRVETLKGYYSYASKIQRNIFRDKYSVEIQELLDKQKAKRRKSIKQVNDEENKS